MKSTAALFAIVLTCAHAAPAAAEWDSTGGDHEGQDWTLDDGAVISGVHTNIGRMVIPDGVTVRVRPHDGDQHGLLDIQACELVVDGALIADEAGAAGGERGAQQGGHVGAGEGPGCGGGPGSCVGQGASGGGYGGAGGQPEQDTNWNGPCDRCDNPTLSHCTGPGGESYGTADGEDVAMGSGGGAGGNSCGCNNAGGLGGAGGGAIKLVIDEEARVDGVISANGETPPLDLSNCGYHPGGGGGSGGGVLLQAVSLQGSGSITAEGGRGGESDGCPSSCGDWAWAGGGGGGGRIKIFSLDDRFDGELSATGGGGGPAPNGNSAFDGEPGLAGTVNRGEALVFEHPGCEGPPRIRLAQDIVGLEAEPVTVTLQGRDPDGGPLEIAWDLDDDGEFDDGDELEVQVTFPDDGEYRVAVRATDDERESAETEATIRVVNQPPRFTSEPPEVAHEGQRWVYRVTGEDPAGERDPLTVAIMEGPQGMEVDGLEVSWTPTPRQALIGRFVVALQLDDGDGGRVRQPFAVDVLWQDSDGDGMSDGWEREFGLDPNDPDDADDDPDGDGLTNREEFDARTDPTRSGRPDAPEPSSPEDGAWVNTPTPSLAVFNAVDPDNDRLTYEFHLAEDREFRRIALQQDAVVEGEARTTWAVRLRLDEGRTYWWRARAYDGVFRSDWSTGRSFTVNAVPEPPGLPRLVSPEDGLPVGTVRPAFEFGEVFDPDGDPVTHHLEVYGDGGLVDLVLDVRVPQEGVDGVVRYEPEEDLPEDASYWWRVEAVDEAGLSSGWTEVWQFRINADNAAPPDPVLLSPSDGASLAARRAVLVVQGDEDPDGEVVHYRIELDRSPDFDRADKKVFDDLAAGVGGAVTVEVTGLDDNTRYHWRARATDGLATTDWVGRTFFVNVANDPPGAPTLLAPAADAAVAPKGLELVLAPARDPDQEPVSHVVQVSGDDGFSSLVFEERVAGDGEQLRVAVSDLAPSATYFWRARGADALRAQGPWSEVRRFYTTDGGTPSEGEGEGRGGTGGTECPARGGPADCPGEGEGGGTLPERGGSRSRSDGCATVTAPSVPSAAWLILGLLALGRRRR